MNTLLKAENTLDLELNILIPVNKFTDQHPTMTPIGDVNLLEQAFNEIIGYTGNCCYCNQ